MHMGVKHSILSISKGCLKLFNNVNVCILDILKIKDLKTTNRDRKKSK